MRRFLPRCVRAGPSSRSSERGTALIGVLLLLMIMTALASALAISGQTETLVARNHETAAQARAAAEAGINHASEVLTAWIVAWKQNGFGSAGAAIDALLAGVDADPDWLVTNYGVNLSFGDDADAVNVASDTSYRVYLMDEDNEDLRGEEDATDLSGLSSIYQEDGDPLNDNNDTIVIQAIGSHDNGASVRLEAIVSPYRLPALVTGGDLDLNGSAVAISVTGDAIGGVHANGDLTIAGTPVIAGVPTELGTATASGTCDDCDLPTVTTNPDDSGGGKPLLDLPEIRASDFLSWADYILHDDGTLEDVDTGTTVDCSPNCKAEGWSGEWTLIDAAGSMATGVFYAEGPVTVSSGTAIAPAEATIIAEGTITGTGNNYIRPAPGAGNLLFVTDVDLVLGGTFQAGFLGDEGQMLVHEQIDIGGNVVLFGQIVAENATSTQNPDDNSVSGNVSLTSSQDVGSSMFHVSGWREVRHED
ncbi:MAG: hypothetical protein HYU37_03560 [Acidobacteria bacterium]|nr:hypothetical protein [Acidobacteriota bacterium]